MAASPTPPQPNTATRVAAADLAGEHRRAEAGHHAAAEQPGDLRLRRRRSTLRALAGGDERLLGEGADAERRRQRLRRRGSSSAWRCTSRSSTRAGPGGTSGTSPHTARQLRITKSPGATLGDVGPDRLDHAGGLVAEQEREVVVDAALPVVQVGVAHAARLHLHERLARARDRAPRSSRPSTGCFTARATTPRHLVRHVGPPNVPCARARSGRAGRWQSHGPIRPTTAGSLAAMKALRSFTVRPALPPELAALEELAMNLRWTWDEQTRDLFRWVDPEQWDASIHDPVRLLGAGVRASGSTSWPATPGFMRFLDEVHTELQRLPVEAAAGSRPARATARCGSVAYFSPEFGIAEALPQYSGGLGVLAGDHLKAARDLGVPARRRRPLLPARLLPPGARHRGLAAGALPRPRPATAWR